MHHGSGGDPRRNASREKMTAFIQFIISMVIFAGVAFVSIKADRSSHVEDCPKVVMSEEYDLKTQTFQRRKENEKNDCFVVVADRRSQ